MKRSLFEGLGGQERDWCEIERKQTFLFGDLRRMGSQLRNNPPLDFPSIKVLAPSYSFSLSLCLGKDHLLIVVFYKGIFFLRVVLKVEEVKPFSFQIDPRSADYGSVRRSIHCDRYGLEPRPGEEGLLYTVDPLSSSPGDRKKASASVPPSSDPRQ